jgi:hypothetical protein
MLSEPESCPLPLSDKQGLSERARRVGHSLSCPWAPLPRCWGLKECNRRSCREFGSGQRVVKAASLSPAAYATVCHGQYGVEGRLST